MSERDEVLGRVRAALADVDPAPATIARDYRRPEGAAGTPDTLELFVKRLSGYDARVHRSHPDRATDTVRDALRGRDLHRMITPEGLDPSWLPATGFEWVRDSPSLSVEDIAGTDGVVTAAAVAVADSGTIVLDGSAGQGRRVLSLLPDAMLVVVRSGQVFAELTAAVASLDGTRPLTFVSGPSATVDIELVRVAGVHGPRNLDVVLLDPNAA